LRVCLEGLLSSIFCETLGYENKPKYLSIHSLKVEKKDRHNQVLSSTSLGGILLPGIGSSWLPPHILALQLAQLTELVSNLIIQECFVT